MKYTIYSNHLHVFLNFSPDLSNALEGPEEGDKGPMLKVRYFNHSRQLEELSKNS